MIVLDPHIKSHLFNHNHAFVCETNLACSGLSLEIEYSSLDSYAISLIGIPFNDINEIYYAARRYEDFPFVYASLAVGVRLQCLFIGITGK